MGSRKSLRPRAHRNAGRRAANGSPSAALYLAARPPASRRSLGRFGSAWAVVAERLLGVVGGRGELLGTLWRSYIEFGSIFHLLFA